MRDLAQYSGSTCPLTTPPSWFDIGITCEQLQDLFQYVRYISLGYWFEPDASRINSGVFTTRSPGALLDLSIKIAS